MGEKFPFIAKLYVAHYTIDGIDGYFSAEEAVRIALTKSYNKNLILEALSDQYVNDYVMCLKRLGPNGGMAIGGFFIRRHDKLVETGALFNEVSSETNYGRDSDGDIPDFVKEFLFVGHSDFRNCVTSKQETRYCEDKKEKQHVLRNR